MKKIIISSIGKDLDSQVNPLFGRAEFFLLVDIDTMEFECINNTEVNQISSGAGIQTAEMVIKTGVKNVLTGGNIGPKAKAALDLAEISYIEDLKGLTVKQTIEKFITEQET